MSIKLKKIFEKYKSHPEFLGLELEDVNQKGAVDDTLLHIAARIGDKDSVRALIDLGANINAEGDMGNTPLHYAAMKGHIEIIEILLKAGVNRSSTNELNQSAVKVAELAKETNSVKALKQR